MRMRKAKLLAAVLVATALFGIAVVRGLAAEGTSSSALTGTVSSPADGAMEGVLVGAKRDGSTISTWVVSNAQGQYSFPRDRMEPGHYAVSIRAVGYELPATSVDLKSESARLDLQLTKIARATKVAEQMTNAELIMSAPGTTAQRASLGGCVNCHALQRVFFSHFEPLEMSIVAARMPRHTNNSSPMHPYYRPQEGPLPAITEPTTAGRYLSSINLSATDTFQFPLKTLPRPKGKATQVIYTVYDLPRPDASPHDVAATNRAARSEDRQDGDVPASPAGGDVGRRAPDDDRSGAHGRGRPALVQRRVRHRRIRRHLARGSREEQVDANHVSEGQPLGR